MMAIPSSSKPDTSATSWFRMLAGGPAPRYVRLRPRQDLQSVIETASEQTLSEQASSLVSKITIEVLTLRPALSYSLPPAHP